MLHLIKANWAGICEDETLILCFVMSDFSMSAVAALETRSQIARLSTEEMVKLT